jgi:hypothetical protein
MGLLDKAERLATPEDTGSKLVLIESAIIVYIPNSN